MSDRRTAIGFFFVGSPPDPPASFDGEPVLWSRAWRHDAVSVLVLACYVHPLADRLASLGPALDGAAHALGARLAIVDPLFNEAAMPSWASQRWDASWEVEVDLLDSLLGRELRWWSVAWVSRASWDDVPSHVRDAVLRGATSTEEAHGILLSSSTGHAEST